MLADSIVIERRRCGDSVELVFCVHEPHSMDEFEGIGIGIFTGLERRGAEYVATLPAGCPNIDVVYENLRRHARTIVGQLLGQAEVNWVSALEVTLRRVTQLDIEWGLVGSAALAVQGVVLRPGDVDIVTDLAGAKELDRVFASELIVPTRPIPGFGTFGRAFLGARIEWLANPGEMQRWAPWERVVWKGHELQATTLAAGLATERARGRLERAAAIVERLHAIGA